MNESAFSRAAASLSRIPLGPDTSVTSYFLYLPLSTSEGPEREPKQIMAKSKREQIKLESTAGTGHFYTTSKNRTNTPNKLEFKKYDPVVRKHVIYKETKLK